jgi:predicted PurR-regulated permease PerM
MQPNENLKMPFYARTALIFISVSCFVYALSIGKQIIVPVLYATIMAILLNPVVNFLVSKKTNRTLAIAMTVLFTVLVIAGMIYALSTQLSLLSETYPQFNVKIVQLNKEVVQWLAGTFNIKRSTINTWSVETQADAINDFFVMGNLAVAGEIIVISAITPVYLFLILYYKPLLIEFLRRVFTSKNDIAVADVLSNAKSIIQRYVIGLFIEMIIIAGLNSASLALLGLEYAIILGITGAVLNVVPYIGGVIAIALPMIIAFVTKDSLTYPLMVLLFYGVIQFIDNHYIIPRIVASRVQINALASIVVVLMGGMLWGIPGMFLSIPLTAIVKVIFDHIEPLKPWGFLLGNIVQIKSSVVDLKLKAHA